MTREQDSFRTWADGMGLLVRRQPEAFQGEGGVWGVPLNRRRGWLYDAGVGRVGVDYRSTPKVVNAMARRLAVEPDFRLQTHAVDAVVGTMPRTAEVGVLLGVLDARRARRNTAEVREAMTQRLRALGGQK